jgi:hypothetical protein
VTNGTNDVSATKPIGSRKVIHATCTRHGGARGFTNLAVSKRDGVIELDLHVLRHEALCCIPYRVGRDLEEYLWV